MLKNLKTLFIVEESKPNNLTESTKKEVEAPKVQPSNPTISSSPSSKAVDDIMQKLLKVLEDNNLEGFDYIEYKKSLQALSKMPMDEPTQYRSAFATASTMGASLEKIIESISFYKSILAKEDTKFLSTLKTQVDTKVFEKEKQIEELHEKIVQNTEQINQLTEEINKTYDDISELTSKISQDKQRIDQTKENFTYTYNCLVSEIDADLNKINEYLK